MGRATPILTVKHHQVTGTVFRSSPYMPNSTSHSQLKPQQERRPVFNTECTDATHHQSCFRKLLRKHTYDQTKLKSMSVTKSVCQLTKDSPL